MMQPESHDNERRQLPQDEGQCNIPEFPSQRYLDKPPLDDVQKTLESALKEGFKDVSVSVVQCPDLRNPPFRLAAPGLCGNTIVMVIGTPSQAPYENLSTIRSWHLLSLLHQVSFRSFSFVIGAHYNLRHNILREVVANFTYSPFRGIVNNNSHMISIGNKRFESKFASTPESVTCDMHGTYFLSDGSPGNVLKVLVKNRRRHDYDFVTAICSALNTTYDESSLIALGGTFIAKNGIVKVFRRPELQSNFANIDNSYSVCAPLVAVGTMFNRNIPYDSKTAPKISYANFYTFVHETIVPDGHFVGNIMPNITEYEGYFNLATKLIYQLPELPNTANTLS